MHPLLLMPLCDDGIKNRTPDPTQVLLTTETDIQRKKNNVTEQVSNPFLSSSD